MQNVGTSNRDFCRHSPFGFTHITKYEPRSAVRRSGTAGFFPPLIPRARFGSHRLRRVYPVGLEEERQIGALLQAPGHADPVFGSSGSAPGPENAAAFTPANSSSNPFLIIRRIDVVQSGGWLAQF